MNENPRLNEVVMHLVGRPSSVRLIYCGNGMVELHWCAPKVDLKTTVDVRDLKLLGETSALFVETNWPGTMR